LLFLLQALGQHADSGFDLTVLSNHALSVGSECPCPEKALLLGLCSVAPQEFSHVSCRFVDVDLQGHSADQAGPLYAPLAAQLVAEVDGRSFESVIALRGSQRWVRRFDPVSIEEASASPLRHGGTYLLTGGLTGNGFSIARYLAGRWQANLIFLETGASALQPGVVSPELITSRLRVQKLEGLGARVLLLNADITNKNQLLNAWEATESSFGEIHGVIHAEEPSGENTFRAISEAQREDFTLLFRPKIHALFALESVLQTKKVDFCVLLSSLASVLGGIGYGGYTAANLFMDAFAQDRNRSGNVRWLSLNCDLWLGEDRRDEITKVRGDLVDLAMTEAEGEEAFSRALRPGAADQILVSTADLNARIADSKQRIENLRKRERESEHTNAPAVLHARPSLPNAYVGPETELEKRIGAVWQRVLGFEQVGLDDNFFDLGGDSLVAIQMAKHLKQELELDFPVAKLYQGVTIRALAQLLAQDEIQSRKQLAVELGELKQNAVERREFQKRARARKQEARA
jgi:acyl carrier protein